MTTEVNEVLTLQQKSRIEALKAARDVLAARLGMLGGSNVPAQFDHYAIITVAEWILDPDAEKDSPETDDADRWKSGFLEGAHSAVNRYRQIAQHTSDISDQVLSELVGDDAHRREPEADTELHPESVRYPSAAVPEPSSYTDDEDVPDYRH